MANPQKHYSHEYSSTLHLLISVVSPLLLCSLLTGQGHQVAARFLVSLLKKCYLNWLKLISWANNNFVDAKVILVALQQNVFSSLVFPHDNLLLLTISLSNDFPSVREYSHTCYQNFHKTSPLLSFC